MSSGCLDKSRIGDILSYMRQYSAPDVLRSVPLLQIFSMPALTALVLEKSETRHYKRGDIIFSPQSAERALGFVLLGSALVYKPAPRMLMSRLVPGQVFGMASLFGSETHPTEIYADALCSVLFWPRQAVEEAFVAEPALSARYIALLSDRIQFLGRRIDMLSGDDLPMRLLRLLQGLRAPDKPEEGFMLPYTISQLAEMLGVGRASLYRALGALQEKGCLERDGRRVIRLSGTVAISGEVPTKFD